MVSRVRFADARAAGRAQLDSWDLGGVTVLRADLTGDLVLSGAGEDTAPAVSFAVQEEGGALQDHFDHRRGGPPGGPGPPPAAPAHAYPRGGPGGRPRRAGP